MLISHLLMIKLHLMDIQQIKNFLKLSEELHFWRTASLMNITQSALSRQIMALEEELGVSLFERNKRNVKLTDSGVFLREKWSVLLNDLNYVHLFARKLSQGETGSIRIAHPDSISYSVVPDVLVRINNIYPELSVELVQLLYENVQQSLQDFKIDIAFTRQINKLTGISSKKINSESVALFVPIDHPYTNYSDINKENLADQQFILPVAERKSSYHFMVAEIFASYGFAPKSNYQSDFGSSILGLVSSGLGIAILPKGFEKNGVPGIRAIQMPYTTDLFVSWRSDEKSLAIQNVLHIIAE